MRNDYTKYSFILTILVIAVLLGVSLIPPFEAFGMKFKRANILSDIIEFPDEIVVDADAGVKDQDRSFIEELERMEAEATSTEELPESETAKEPSTDTWELGSDVNIEPAVQDREDNTAESGQGQATDFKGVVEFEDFTQDGAPTIADFCALLGEATTRRIVRIAFLGDSYIEGDIITADVRAQLQETYGGGGVGFVPFSTPLAQNRPTVKHAYKGWTNYTLIKKKSAPEELQERFYVSGTVSVPSPGAWSEYHNTTFRKRLSSVGSIRLLFENTGQTEIDMTVNDTITRRFIPEAAEGVQQIYVSGGQISSLRVDLPKAEGFYGYGIVLERGPGIAVDNYSIRSNSGLALFGTKAAVNRRINSLLGYDMIVMQYGLNAMDPDNTNYSGYGAQLRKAINYMKSCFPQSVIVLMGVGDRSTQSSGEFVTMEAVKSMRREQRAAAQECGVVFWDTYLAMGGEGSMARFVENGWAAKDYTHLSFGGGRRIATQFVKALEYVKHTISGGAEEAEPENLTGASAPQRAERLDTFDNLNVDTVRTDTTQRITLDGLEMQTQTDGVDTRESSPGNTADTLSVHVETIPADSLRTEIRPTATEVE